MSGLNLVDSLLRGIIPETPESEASRRMVVRVTTTWFQRGRSYVEQKSITPLRRLSGHEFYFDEEVTMIGVDEAIPKIKNLHQVKDGIYQIVFCNERRDWESGTIDDYDYKLIPYTVKPKA